MRVFLWMAIVLSLVSIGLADTKANDIRFPPGANVFNVVTDGGLDNTGTIDNTEKLNKLLSEDFGRRLQVMYFPKGTYLISGMVRGKHDQSRKSTSHSHGPWVVGESRIETIIRLKDGTWPTDPFEGEKLPKVIDQQVAWHTGDCTNTTFNQILHNLTINIGSNNGGATGLVYITSNTGHLSNVDIVSEDGRGALGVALTGSENGPGQLRDVRIRGFKRGLFNVAPYHMAMSNLSIEGAEEVGLLNRGKMAGENIRIDMKGDAVALRNHDWLCLVGGQFTGQGTAAVVNQGHAYLRDIQAQGFARALESKDAPEGLIVTEYASAKPVQLFEGEPTPPLSIESTPWPRWETDMSKWANAADLREGRTWTQTFAEAMQQSGKTHLVVPLNYDDRIALDGPVTIGGDYSRIVGTPARVDAEKTAADAVVIIGDGSAPVVVIQEFMGLPSIIVRTDRDVIIDSVSVRRGSQIIMEGAGRLFLHNTHAPVVVKNPKARVWARHYNHEAKVLALDVQAGSMWVLGFKAENLHQRAKVGPQGRLEVLGFDSYEVGRDTTSSPIFEVDNGQLRVACLVQHGSRKFDDLVRVSRDGDLRTLKRADNADGFDCVLFGTHVAGQAR